MDNKSLLSGLNVVGSKGFKQLLDTQSLVDCTLACDGGKISAHKVVLSACSSYLANILLEHPVEHPIIILPELNIEDVKTLVHYMYTGELLRSNTLPTHSSHLLRTAAMLSVNSLSDFLNGTTSNHYFGDQTTISPNSGGNLNTASLGNSSDNSIANNNINSSNNSNNSNNNGPKSDFQFKCPVCQNDFQTICSFEYHMQRIHNVTSFGCEICHKPFASLRYVLTDHMRRCHGWKAEQKLQC